MEKKHEKLLSITCRVCARRIKGYNQLARLYRNEILKVFNYDINNDNVNQPQNVCNTCRIKFTRVKTIAKVKNYQLYQFVGHSDNNCYVCVPHREILHFSISSIEKHTDALFKLIRTTAVKYNFNCGQTYIHQDSFIEVFNTWIVNSVMCVKFLVQIKNDFTLNLFVGKKRVSVVRFAHVTESNVDALFSYLNKMSICIGNSGYPQILERKVKPNNHLIVTDRNFVDVNNCSILRSLDCKIIVAEFIVRCQNCQNCRKDLSSLLLHSDSGKIYSNDPPKNVENKQMEDCENEVIKDCFKEESKKEVIVVEDFVEETNYPYQADTPESLIWDQQNKRMKLN